MVSRMDRDVGRLVKLVQELGIEQDTLILFTSDNGPHNESNHDLKRFNPSGPYTGIKRSLTDGGIRVPLVAWWPGKIKPQTETGHVSYFGDWMATATELAESKPPAGIDSISMVPTLLGKNADQPQHEFLYWEFHENGFKQAALYLGRWKGIRKGSPDAPIMLYDQFNDVAETSDVASKHPDVATKISDYLKSARSESTDWKPTW